MKNSIHNNKVKFKKNYKKTANGSAYWIVAISIFTFFLSSLLLILSQEIFKRADIFISLLVVIIIVLFGIIFDMIGIAVTAADETPFHAMASKKFFGSKQSIKLIRNANKVATICNDVVGDICGVISGTASALLIVKISTDYGISNKILIGVAISGIVASLTVAGKAVGKTLSIRNSNIIVYRVASIIEFLTSRST